MADALLQAAPADETLALLPARQLAARIAAKQVSPVEVVEAVLRRIERLEPALNAMACVDPDGARAAARDAEAAVMRGGPLGTLHGLTVTIKDIGPVRGLPFERGSRILAGNVAAEDSPMVARLRAAGAVVVVVGETTVCRVRLERGLPQPGDRDHPQPLAARP